MKIILRQEAFLLCAVLLVLTGCAHRVAFEDVRYTIGGQRQLHTIVAVIDEATLAKVVPIRAYMTGIAQSWETQPGEMLKAVADLELPQMFERYESATRLPAADNAVRKLTLVLTIPHYDFSEFHASIRVRAVATATDGKTLFDKVYSGEGETQGGKMFLSGAFGMKSAIRQSSLDAYKKIFAQMRTDLAASVVALPKP
ncbi:MAG: hypothetical protein ABI905_01830 [Betaproteobacteria bacterium]